MCYNIIVPRGEGTQPPAEYDDHWVPNLLVHIMDYVLNGKVEDMSKRTDMLNRIAVAMPEDVEVQGWVFKELERAGRSAAKTQERLDMALRVIKGHVVEPVSAKDFAHEVNLQFGVAQNWNTRTAAYYLRQLVLNGVAEEVPYEGNKTGPKMYIYVG